MKTQVARTFREEEHRTWTLLFDGLERSRESQAAEVFVEGIRALGLTRDRIPELKEVNRALIGLTGWKGIAVEGYEDGASFYPALARREYPIGNFIRDSKDISYTPAPDVFHDLYGHLPFLADRRYADFCRQYGERASRYVLDPARFRMWERFFWYAVEFPLVETPRGRRIFGAGILSSRGECDYALSDKPKLVPFEITSLISLEFFIDRFQETLFVLDSPEQLYGSLDELEAAIRRARVPGAKTASEGAGR